MHVVEYTAGSRHVYNRSATTTTALSAKRFVNATPAVAGERSPLAAALAASLRCYRQRVSENTTKFFQSCSSPSKKIEWHFQLALPLLPLLAFWASTHMTYFILLFSLRFFFFFFYHELEASTKQKAADTILTVSENDHEVRSALRAPLLCYANVASY